jgi:hypothetical protein
VERTERPGTSARRPPPPRPPPPIGLAASVRARWTRKRKSATPDQTPSAPPEEEMPELDFIREEEIVVIPGVKTLTGYSVITDVALTCGGNRVDSLFELNTENDAIADFIRMGFFNGTLNTPFSHSLSYHQFITDSYFTVFDFSTAQNSNLLFLTPSTRFGHIRAEITFSKPLPSDVTMLVMEEYPSEIHINNERQIGFSYLNTTAT